MEALGLIVTAVVGITLVAALAALMRGWVLSILWAWFFVPLGAPAISIPLAIGVALVVAFLTHQESNCEREKKDMSERVGSIIGTILAPLLILGVGWIIKQFV